MGALNLESLLFFALMLRQPIGEQLFSEFVWLTWSSSKMKLEGIYLFLREDVISVAHMSSGIA